MVRTTIASFFFSAMAVTRHIKLVSNSPVTRITGLFFLRFEE
jgi:hypothetical protein